MDDIVVEFISQGRFVKVSAIDMKSGLEASIVGDPSAGEAELKRLAVQKLKYVIEKRRKEGSGPGGRGGPGLVI